MTTSQYILLTIDVEDWFQVENFKPYIPFSSWPERELRVEQNTHNLLNLFDSVDPAGKPEARGRKAKSNHNGQPTTGNGHQFSSFPASRPQAERRPKATFFILGWIAERLPQLVKEIHARGHEVASHGYNHNRCNQQSHREVEKELLDSKKRLEDIAGSEVIGFRAPNFSVDDEILKRVADCGYSYDSSYNSFSLHGRYGAISLNGEGKTGIAHKLSERFFEIPISNLKLGGKIFPLGGGAYFRLMPLALFQLGINVILRRDNAYVFYLHPWEIDPDQPRVTNASAGSKFRHYTNQRRTYLKLTNLINNFSHCEFITCSRYLNIKI